MAAWVSIDSQRVVGPAVLFKEICEKNHIPLPDLRHILGILVTAKICPDHWQDIASRAYPKEARTFTLQLANTTAITNLKERPMDALHILGTARLSTDANASGVFKNFCAHIEHQPTSTSQLLFFASHLLESHPDAIWNSDFIAKALNTTTDSVRRHWIPRIQSFMSNTSQQILHENYALLLSGIHFDYNRLEQKSLNAANFPCLQPPQLLASKPHMYAELFKRVETIKSMQPMVNVHEADPDAIATADDLMAKVVPGNCHQFKKREIAAGIQMADKVIEHLESVMLTDQQIRQKASTEFESLRSKVAVARTQADYRKLESAGQIDHLKWAVPKITMRTSTTEIHELIGKLKFSLAILDRYKN